MKSPQSRRGFLKRSAGLATGATLAAGAPASATAISSSRVLGANNRIRIGLIGCGGRGGDLKQFLKIDGIQFHGNEGVLVVDRHGWEVHPETDKIDKDVREFRSLGKPRHNIKTYAYHLTHVENFVDCMRSRERPNADVFKLNCFKAIESLKSNSSWTVDPIPIRWLDPWKAREVASDLTNDRPRWACEQGAP